MKLQPLFLVSIPLLLVGGCQALFQSKTSNTIGLGDRITIANQSISYHGVLQTHQNIPSYLMLLGDRKENWLTEIDTANKGRIHYQTQSLDWFCTPQESPPNICQINGQTFDLSKGRVFVSRLQPTSSSTGKSSSTVKSSFLIEQLSMDLPTFQHGNLTNDANRIKQFIQGNPKVIGVLKQIK